MLEKERLSLTSYLLEIPAFPWTRTFPEKKNQTNQKTKSKNKK
jgi:hypothetical protein